ncbi:sulfoxide reductase heme-binding subunit YedZ [Ursidibacter maritimus]|uniref:Protein-methionine-sulfoxide reductase heme-binding subunit MsrQ n=1 Tax=Ursidibacter maritimus TaxID=1331689 RepID=A0A949WGP1_9PAST|nr:protein-methionine-sulfoxide reductase heme-binding subunit MsrQ [Ursidibacter maritimus]KAE9542157.1 sulfoxide reductase heme-binding subunit YedZ [Ursidibacter maritimus]MBV6524202.1 sulfoxide reductase heme-binding subunit YedZ [Ursidibacter maritimus]MBV6525150.1 sulfoxide reductase heme-binding subunit YedZ [Ursidibacter maritimus]MBV6528413.1 sulfoxide reductase heme-binding subunit YedZ [Ursidibacter maritimus]MBV6530071.1 sulfoxide reductase heme-binding subunit YedZ [Ursidibacter m
MLTLYRVIIHLGCFAPFVWLASVLLSENETALGADPIKEIEHFLGYTAIVIFCIMFLLGIVLQLVNKNQYQILRRPLGLWAFFYALLHVASYLALELNFDFTLFFEELVERPYLIFGGIAFIILLIMAITSLPSIKNALGKKWFTIHQFAYLAIISAGIHYYWSVKSITLEPIIIGAIITLIVVWRYLSRYILPSHR